MRHLLVILCLLGIIFSGCQSLSPSGSEQAITSVLSQKDQAARACARIVLDGDKIMSVNLHGTDYLAAIKKIDVSGCPEPFRAAWSAYLAAWEKKLKAENAGEDTLDLISMWKGEAEDLPEAYRHLEAYDTEAAWQRCVQAAAAYGVKIAATESAH